MNNLMTPNHPVWDDFIECLGGPAGINTKLEGDKLTWDCGHSYRLPLTRDVLTQYPDVGVEAAIAWFGEQQWRCDYEAVFYSDATDEEPRIWNSEIASLIRGKNL